jgi:hypothetical protein
MKEPMKANPRTLVLLIVLLGPATAGAAPLGVPDPRFSSFEAVVIGCPSGTAIQGCPDDGPTFAAPGYQVVVRDVNNSTLVGIAVTLDFSATSMKLFTDSRSGTTFNCATRTVTRITNGSGAVTFSPRIAGAVPTNSIELSANGVVLGNVKGRSTDFDGDGHTGLTDLARLAANFVAQSQDRSTDLDGCADFTLGATTLVDFDIFAAEFVRTIPDAPCN